MQSQLVLYILGALAFSCVAEEAACTATGDADDDRCTLLQGKVGVSSIDKGAEQQQGQQRAKVIDHAKEHHAESSDGSKAVSKGASDQAKEHVEDMPMTVSSMSDHAKEHTEGDSEGWPDILKKITDVFSGAGQLEKDFDAVKDAVAKFEAQVHTAEKTLLDEFDNSKSLDFNIDKVSHFYGSVHDAAEKVHQALKKVADAWVNGIGKVVPHQFKSVLTSTLTTANDQAKIFTASFKTAEDSLHSFHKATNTTIVCAKVKEGLHGVLKKASELVKSTTGLSTKGFSKDLKAARDALPESLQEQINKVLKKANDAADQILSKLIPAMKEITHGVTKVFEDKCPHLHSGAGQLKAGLLLGLVLGVLSFSV